MRTNSDVIDKTSTVQSQHRVYDTMAEKDGKPGGANLLHRKYFYGKKLKSYETPLNEAGLQPHSPTLSAAYAMTDI